MAKKIVMEIDEDYDDECDVPTAFYTLTEVAKILGVSYNTVRKLIAEKQLPYVMITSTHYKVLKNDLLDFIRNHRNAATGEFSYKKEEVWQLSQEERREKFTPTKFKGG